MTEIVSSLRGWIDEFYVDSIPLPIRIVLRIISLQGFISFIYSTAFNCFVDPKKQLSNPPGVLSWISSTLVTPFVFWRRRDQQKNHYQQHLQWDSNTFFMVHWMLLIAYTFPTWLSAALTDLGLVDERLEVSTSDNEHGLKWSENGQMHPLSIGITIIFVAEVVGRCQRKETLKNLEATLRWVWIIIPISISLALYLFVIPRSSNENDDDTVFDNSSGDKLHSSYLFGFGLDYYSSTTSASLQETAHNEGCGMAFYILLLMSRYVLDAFRDVGRIFFVFYGAPQLLPILKRWNRWRKANQTQASEGGGGNENIDHQKLIDNSSSRRVIHHSINNAVTRSSLRSSPTNGSHLDGGGSRIFIQQSEDSDAKSSPRSSPTSRSDGTMAHGKNKKTDEQDLLPEWARSHHSLLRESIQLIVGISILPIVLFLCGIVSSCSSSYYTE